MNSGALDFMKGKDVILLPDIVDENNHIVKKVRLEEVVIVPQDINAVNHMSDRILNQK